MSDRMFADLEARAERDLERVLRVAARSNGRRDAPDWTLPLGRGRADWPEPAPLPDPLPPVAAFDRDLLPEALRGWIMDVAERMQCPADFCAVAAVVALSGLIGARAVVRPKLRDDWTVTANVWGVAIGSPGSMKSPALMEVLRPLHRLEAKAREAWEAARAEWEIEAKAAMLVAKAAEREAAEIASKDRAAAARILGEASLPPEPTMRRYIVNDATVEALQEVVRQNPWGVLVYRDELHSLLCSLDRQGQEGSRGFFLTAWNGDQSYVVDRIGRGCNLHAKRVCLALLGTIQPGRLQAYVREAVRGGAGDDGLLQRFGLAVWPDPPREYRYIDRPPDAAARERAWAVFERLDRLQPDGDEPQVWRFAPAAHEHFVEWLVALETELRSDAIHPALASHLSKYRKLVPALALIFALVDDPASEGRMIHERELLRALAWSEYLRTHAERVYSAAVMPELETARTLWERIRAGKVPATFTPRQVAARHWVGLATPEAVRRAAEVLVEYNWLAREEVPPGPAGGRPSERYIVNPLAIRGEQ
jgi:putative DNA primase/helicase